MVDDHWQPCKHGFFLPVRMLSRLFRRLFCEQLLKAHHDGKLKFFGELVHLQDRQHFTDYLAPLRNRDWVVYAKRPFAEPEAVLAYLSRYTHRVAISNHRLISHNNLGVTFNWKDYRSQSVHYKPMTLSCDEFIRRFLTHVLPKGFHRIRHYGLLASHVRRKNLVRLRTALDVYEPESLEETTERAAPFVCRTCGEPLRIIETLNPKSRAPP